MFRDGEMLIWDVYAAATLTGIVSAMRTMYSGDEDGDGSSEFTFRWAAKDSCDIAEAAADIADAMIAEREKRQCSFK
jgi:hypothetical protein